MTTAADDDGWVVDPGDGKRTYLARCAEYGHCACHSRSFWGLRLHLVCTLQRLRRPGP